MIDIPDTHECNKGNKCSCVSHPTRLVGCKFIVSRTNPGEAPVDPSKAIKRRQEVEEAYAEVKRLADDYVKLHELLGQNPLNAASRRMQQKAFHDLGAAQHRLSEAFTFVPPKARDEQISPPVA